MKSTLWLAATASFALLAVSGACAKAAESHEAPKSATEVIQGQPAAAKADPAMNKVIPAHRNIDLNQLNANAVAAGEMSNDNSYSLTLDAPREVANGVEGTVQVTVTPKQGWKMNKEFPTKLQVTAPAGVTLGKDTLSVGDAVRFDEKGATFAVTFKAETVGQKSFAAKFKFAVCTDAT